jgi:aryl-alcohol dehydrogenase-like predicted oxidoreductase
MVDPMEYRTVGRTGIKVSQLCMGTMTFGDPADELESKRMFEACLDAGVNFFDSADVYVGGLSEEVLGRLMQGKRDELIITSKVFGRTGNDVNAGGLSRRHITRAVEASLRRLGTDRLDFYFLHEFDPSTPIDETLGALDDLVHRGLILHPAVSNWAAWQIMKAQGVAAKDRLARFELIQPMYNLSKRQAEVEILPMAQADEMGVIPYNPLGGGLLTGKYTTTTKPDQGRLIENKMYSNRYAEREYYEIAERFVALADTLGEHPVTLALAWVDAHPAVTAPIMGARNLEQLEPSLAAAKFDMTPEVYDQISALSPEPPPAHDRSEERKP